MNQQNEGLGSSTPSNVPNKRKRGRPRKMERGVQGTNMPVMAGSANGLNSNQTAGTTDDCFYEKLRQMVGQVVPGVIEGTFDGGYFLKVQVAGTYLRGAVFLPGRVVPVTAENDVAQHVRMIERKEMPIPVLNPETQISSSVSSPGQCNKQLIEPELQVPMSVDQVHPTELHSGIPVSLENQSASIVVPMADLPNIHYSIPTGGQAKESTADGGATKGSDKTHEPFNLVPTVENTEKGLRTGQQSVPSVHKQNELISDEAKCSNIEKVVKMEEEVWHY